jgi:uncharacterized membrane protein
MFIKLYAVAFPVFLAMDMVWLGFVAKNFYRSQIGFLTASEVNLFAALAFYLLFIGGLVLFVIAPALEKKSYAHALLLGGVFGLVTYGTFDLSNLATIKDWPVLVTVVDMAWGATLSASVSVVTFLFARKFAFK